jgi:peptidoglycan/LPS O-acetylase OafA/YrhL
MTEARAARSGVSALGLSAVLAPGAFRLVLASAVVISHVSRFDIGRLAVLLFFFLSGYWTAKIWTEKFQGRRLGRFYLSRYWRIAPLFLLVTLAAAWIRGFDLRLENFTLLGVGSSSNDPTGVSWSLDVELQFYLLVPLIAGLVARAPIPVLLACIPIGVAGWWLDDQHHMATVAKYLPAFVLGTLTYARGWKPGPRLAYGSLAAFASFTLLTAATPYLLSTNRDERPFDQDIWALVWMLPLLPYVAHSLTVRSSKLDRHMGNLSYPLYLIHFPTIAVLGATLGHSLGAKAIAVAASFAISIAVYAWLDRPIDAARVRVTET